MKNTIVKANLLYPLNGGTVVCEFSFPKTAIAYARELGLTVFKVTVGSATVASEGLWPR